MSVATALPVVVVVAPAVTVPAMAAPRGAGVLVRAVAVTTVPAVAVVVARVVVVRAVAATTIPAVGVTAAPAVVVGLGTDGRPRGVPGRRRRSRRGTSGTDNGSACHGHGGKGDTHTLREAAQGSSPSVRSNPPSRRVLLSLVRSWGAVRMQRHSPPFADSVGSALCRRARREVAVTSGSQGFVRRTETSLRVNHTMYGSASAKFQAHRIRRRSLPWIAPDPAWHTTLSSLLDELLNSRRRPGEHGLRATRSPPARPSVLAAACRGARGRQRHRSHSGAPPAAVDRGTDVSRPPGPPGRGRRRPDPMRECWYRPI